MVVGGSATGCETAELVRAGGAEVIIVENGRQGEGGEYELPADVVALAIGWRPTGATFSSALVVAGVDVQIIGDADTPGDFVSVINAGADAALSI